jgi:oxygen-independent coproporphyrinogen-3 oxidase
LHRSDTTADILRILAEAPEAGFDDYNVDLMCGLPEQTEESWRQTYEAILRIRPTHICVFPVSVRHEGIGLYDSRTTLPPPSRSRRMYEEAYEQLCAAGYERTTRHNFRLGRHDCTYERMMALLHPVIGLGAHSVSQSKDCIYKNHSHLGKYAASVSKGDLAVMTGYIFPDQENRHNFAVRKVEYLRLDGQEFARQFGVLLHEAFPEQIALLEEFGLVKMRDDDLELTHDGVYYTAAVKRTFFHPSAWERFESMRPEEFKIERGMFDTVENQTASVV